MEIHPPNLHSAGLGAALEDLLAPLTARGIATHLELDGPLDLGQDIELLVFRAAGEAVRTFSVTQRRTTSRSRSRRPRSGSRLQVVDDGIGFSAAQRVQRQAEGHVGLTILTSVAAGRGGTLDVESELGAGTRFLLEVPRR